MSKKAIVFDMDGTLVDSLEELADATNYALVKCGYKVQPLENFKRYVGDGAKMLLYRATEKDLSEQEYKEIYFLYTKGYLERYWYKTKIYITEARNNRITILNPDINLSEYKYVNEENGIRCP